jgi:hypothetical protein
MRTFLAACNERRFTDAEDLLSQRFHATIGQSGDLRRICDVNTKNHTLTAVQVISQTVANERATVIARLTFRGAATVDRDSTILILEGGRWRVTSGEDSSSATAPMPQGNRVATQGSNQSAASASSLSTQITPRTGYDLWKDSRGCEAELPTAAPGTIVDATVPCLKGRMEGVGRIRMRKDGITTLVFDIEDKSGLAMHNGRITLSILPQDFPFELTRCVKNPQTATGVVRVPDALALHYQDLADSVIVTGLRKLYASCPAPPPTMAASNPGNELYVVRDSVLEIRPASAIHYKLSGEQLFADFCSNRGYQPILNCRRVSPALVQHRHLIDSIAAFEASEIESLARQQRAAAEIVAARRRAEQDAAVEKTRVDLERKASSDRAARYAAFIRANGISESVDIQTLAANPFPYRGKVIGVLVSFESMRDATSAWFNGHELLVTAVPSTTFRNRAQVFLAGRVVGTTVIVVMATQVTIPQMQYVGAYFCKEIGCAELRP